MPGLRTAASNRARYRACKPLRLALFEFDRLIREGLSKEDFERWRSFVSKNVSLLTKTKAAELGYAIDSLYYGIPDYKTYIQHSLARLTLDDVNQAIRRRLQNQDIQLVSVAKDCEELRKKRISNEISPMKYNSPKPPEIIAEDKLVERFKIDSKPVAVKVVPVDGLFE